MWNAFKNQNIHRLHVPRHFVYAAMTDLDSDGLRHGNEILKKSTCIDWVMSLRAVYMESWTRQYTGWQAYSNFLIKVMLCFKADTFFISLRQGGISLETDGISGKKGKTPPSKCLILR